VAGNGDEQSPHEQSRIRELISSASSVIGPAGAATALLFYFGYASSRAQYEYFGLDVDTIGLGTQDFVMRSPQPLLVPLLALGLTSAAVAGIHTSIRRRIDALPADSPVRRPVHSAMLGSVVAGAATLSVGVVMLFAYGNLRDWRPYPIFTSLTLASGAAVTVYSLTLRRVILGGRRSGNAVLIAVYLILAASTFWATATLAQLSGRGSAQYSALHLDRFPGVILDTKERLHLTSPGVIETTLPVAADQTFRYRYRNLRLLINGRDRLFLVPDVWSPSNSTLMIMISSDVRVQFRFQNDPP